MTSFSRKRVYRGRERRKREIKELAGTLACEMAVRRVWTVPRVTRTTSGT